MCMWILLPVRSTICENSRDWPAWQQIQVDDWPWSELSWSHTLIFLCFSMFGCPYNLHPGKPWLRRTIRGAIATGVVVASPVLLVGAATVAVFALPTVGVYRLVRHVRARRLLRHLNSFSANHPNINGLIDDDLFNDPLGVIHPDALEREIRDSLEDLRRHIAERNFQRDFPLFIFADMDVENLFTDSVDDHSHTAATDFRTCPNTPAVPRRLHVSRSLNNLTSTNGLLIHRPLSIDLPRWFLLHLAFTNCQLLRFCSASCDVIWKTLYVERIFLQIVILRFLNKLNLSYESCLFSGQMEEISREVWKRLLGNLIIDTWSNTCLFLLSTYAWYNMRRRIKTKTYHHCSLMIRTIEDY